jgi:hypothetical protein
VRGGGCSAGRCACPCSRSTLPSAARVGAGPSLSQGVGTVVRCTMPQGGDRWSAMVLDGLNLVRDPSANTLVPRVRSAARGGQTAPGTTIGRRRRLRTVTGATRSITRSHLASQGGLWVAPPVG